MRWILLFFLSLGFDAHADKDFWMEPYVGFSKMEIRIKESDNKDIADNYVIGVRSGLRFARSFLVGADYHAGGPYTFGPLMNRASWTTQSLGAVLGADYKVIRFWYGLYPSVKFNDSVNKLTYTGNSQKFGFGLELNQKLRANLEIVSYTIDNKELETAPSPTVTPGYEVRETNAYISIPVDF